MFSSENIKELIELANHLDQKGMAKEADQIDNIINKISSMKFKVHPLEMAVALGELPAHLLEGLFDEPAKKDEDSPPKSSEPEPDIKDLLDMLREESSSE